MSKSSNRIERMLEGTLTASRWLLAPFFLGLALGVVILLIKFVQEFYHLAERALTITEAQAILGMLSLIDLALTGALALIVIFSGYENFVSRIDHSNDRDWPSWMASIDFTALKIKPALMTVMASKRAAQKSTPVFACATDRPYHRRR